MRGKRLLDLGKRERQIVETVYRLDEASVAEVRKNLADAPSYSAVRAMLNYLVNKKVLRFRRDGKRYLYRPMVAKKTVGRSALRDLMKTFFGGQPSDAIAALLEISAEQLSDDELDRMEQLIDQARKQNR